jgi:hypothetical protein
MRKKLSPPLTPAIIGLIGVLVGSLISTGANYLLVVRKENAEAVKEKSDREVALKTAARLITNEFVWAQAGANNAVEKKRYLDEAIKFPLDAWRSGRTTIARELPYHDWAAVETAASAIENFQVFRKVHGSSETLPDPMVEILESLVKQIAKGVEALRPYLPDNPPTKAG